MEVERMDREKELVIITSQEEKNFETLSDK